MIPVHPGRILKRDLAVAEREIGRRVAAEVERAT